MNEPAGTWALAARAVLVLLVLLGAFAWRRLLRRRASRADAACARLSRELALPRAERGRIFDIARRERVPAVVVLLRSLEGRREGDAARGRR